MGLFFNWSKMGSFAMAGKDNNALKIFITAFTLTGMFALDLTLLFKSCRIDPLVGTSMVLTSMPHNFETSLA